MMISRPNDDRVDEDGVIPEVRQSQFEVSDRVAVLDARLEEMRQLYDPLQSTVQIRIPSTVRGGHEVYNNGKITNRSVSFSEQQKIVRLVTDLYRWVTEDAEEKLWYSTDEEVRGDGAGFTGRPVYLSFPEQLELSTLHWWADRTFGLKRNIFRLGGEPMWWGSDRTRLHVYGVDRHLWQPISIEVTRDHMLAVLPAGTCGNTVNRLVTKRAAVPEPVREGLGWRVPVRGAPARLQRRCRMTDPSGDPLFQLNAVLWMLQPLPASSSAVNAVLHHEGYAVRSMGQSLTADPELERQLAVGLDLRGAPAPDVLASAPVDDPWPVFECKKSSFGPHSSTSDQAAKILARAADLSLTTGAPPGAESMAAPPS